MSQYFIAKVYCEVVLISVELCLQVCKNVFEIIHGERNYEG